MSCFVDRTPRGVSLRCCWWSHSPPCQRRGGAGGGPGHHPGVIVRGGNPATFGANRPPRRVSVGHVSFGISPWDADGVKKELDTRSLTGRPDTGGKGDIHMAPYQRYHTTTPDGFDLQISNATKATRTVR